MSVSLETAIQNAQQNRIYSSHPLTEEQFELLACLNSFAIHQATNNFEVKKMPAKLLYKVNEELKLALVALLTTCALLNPKRHTTDTEIFFQTQLKIIQKDAHRKQIDFGEINPVLLEQFLIQEMVNDWILYRDICGDGIYALVDQKTALQGLDSYHKGGSPVYEFARFYRKFMEQKIKGKQKLNESFQEIAMKSLSEKLIQEQMEKGISPAKILQQISNGSLLSSETEDTPLLPQHKK